MERDFSSIPSTSMGLPYYDVGDRDRVVELQEVKTASRSSSFSDTRSDNGDHSDSSGNERSTNALNNLAQITKFPTLLSEFRMTASINRLTMRDATYQNRRLHIFCYHLEDAFKFLSKMTDPNIDDKHWIIDQLTVTEVNIGRYLFPILQPRALLMTDTETGSWEIIFRHNEVLYDISLGDNTKLLTKEGRWHKSTEILFYSLVEAGYLLKNITGPKTIANDEAKDRLLIWTRKIKL